ncbi:hypothetical protein DMUE_4536, partial [Dictyocoela muelleri]
LINNKLINNKLINNKLINNKLINNKLINNKSLIENNTQLTENQYSTRQERFYKDEKVNYEELPSTSHGNFNCSEIDQFGNCNDKNTIIETIFEEHTFKNNKNNSSNKKGRITKNGKFLQNHSYYDILEDFLNKNISLKEEDLSSVQSENKFIARESENFIRMPTFPEVIEIFAKIFILDHCERIVKLKNNIVCSFYLIKDEEMFANLVKYLKTKGFYSTWSFSYEWLLYILFYDFIPNNQYKKVLPENVKIIFHSEVKLNMNDMNMIWHMYSKLCTLENLELTKMTIYVYERNKPDVHLKRMGKYVTYYDFYFSQIFKNKFELSRGTHIRSGSSNKKVFNCDYRMFYLHYDYSKLNLTLDLYNPVLDLKIRTYKLKNDQIKLNLKVFNRITTKKYIFNFIFFKNKLKIVKNDNLILPYHEKLIRNIFLSLKNLNCHPMACINLLLRRNFLDDPLFYVAANSKVKKIIPCKHFNSSVNDLFKNICSDISTFIKTRKYIEISIFENFQEIKSIKEFLDNPDSKYVIFRDKKPYLPLKSNIFLIKVRDKSKGALRDIYFIFSKNNGLFYLNNISFLTDNQKTIIQFFRSRLQCWECQ